MKTEFLNESEQMTTGGLRDANDYAKSSLVTVVISCLRAFCLIAALNSFLQGQTPSDQSNPRFTQGDVNDSATMTFGVPMGNYKGRGLDLPVSLSYSSEVWKMEPIGKVNNSIYTALTQSVNEAVFSKYAVSGWKSSLSLPIIEFPKSTSKYDYKGKSYDWPVEGCYGYRVAEVYIHMPDGSTHTLRKNDQPVSTGGVDKTGRFYAVDGSRMRFEANGTDDTGTIYMPDGTTFVLGYTYSYIYDRNGNQLTYNVANRAWTDNIGRTISDPLPATPTVGNYDYYLPGLSGVGTGQLKYTFKWKLLENALTPDSLNNTPALKVVASESLPDPGLPPSSTNYPSAQNTSADKLFKSTPPFYGANGPLVSGLIVGKGYSAGQPFDPVVLSEIVLPDGTSYKFSYNVHGELDKVVYPTNAYDKYDYTGYQPDSRPPEPDPGMDPEEDQQPYLQSMRWISKRQQSSDGLGDDTQEWNYINAPLIDGGGTLKIISPDKTRTEIFKYGAGPKTWATTGSGGQTLLMIYAFGFKDARAGIVQSKRFYSTSSDGNGGTMLRQEVYDYSQTTHAYALPCNSSRTFDLSRTPRLSRMTSIIFEGSGDALSQSNTYGYDLTNEYTTGIDQISASTYNYVVVTNAVAQAGDLSQIPVGSLAKQIVTTYSGDLDYASANILGLPTSHEIRDGSGTTVVSRSEMSYDDDSYVPTGAKRGLPTTMRNWVSTKGGSTDPSAYLVTHATYDSYGNRTVDTDAKQFRTTTAYDPTYHTYPISQTSPVPDNTATFGSSSAFTTLTSFDITTGLVMSTTDANGQTTSMEYNDALLRPTKSIAPNGQQTITEYGAGVGETSRWVRVKRQIDDFSWDEATNFYDGIGRTFKILSKNSTGDILTQKQYDNMNRVWKVSNPFRVDSNGTPLEAVYWTVSAFDDLGRVLNIQTADGAQESTSYSLATSGSQIGNIVTFTDQSSRSRRNVINALGLQIRTDEPDGNNQLGTVSSPNQATVFIYDALDNLTAISQGVQNRNFVYDSLSRLSNSNNPESGPMQFLYDNNGNLITKVDARSVSTTYTYDPLNRLLVESYSDGTPSVNYFYDNRPNAKGRFIKYVSTTSTTEYTNFDNVGRITGFSQTTDGQTFSSSYSYNLDGAQVEEVYPSGRVVRTTYNENGDLAQVQGRKQASGFWTYANSFSYTASGAIESMQLGNGHWESTKFNNRLQPTEVALGITRNATNILKIDYDYGTIANNGNVLSQSITAQGLGQTAGFTIVQNYTYDFVNRLKQVVEKPQNYSQIDCNQNPGVCWQQTFLYDRYGNRNFDEANTTTLTKSCGTVPNVTICNSDRMIENPVLSAAKNRFVEDQDNDGLNDYVYDMSGNLGKDSKGRTFIYDAENRMVEARDVHNQQIARNYYDGDGKRVKKVVFENGVAAENTIFVYDASGKTIAEYSTSISQNTNVNYLTTDNLATPRINTDENGKVISRHDYMPFGEELNTPDRLASAGFSADSVRKKFAGYEHDSEIGLDFAETRMYDCKTGRFNTADSVQMSNDRLYDPQQINLYSYVRNNPLKFVDPDGELLKLSGNLQDAINGLIDILGTEDAKDRITVDPTTNTITVDLRGIDLSLNEGASLLNDVVNDNHVFEFSVGPSAQTLGGRVFLAANGQRILNLDNNPDDRYQSDKSPQARPQNGVDDLVAIDPAGDQFVSGPQAEKKKKKKKKNAESNSVPLLKPLVWTTMFHELAEAYEKIAHGKRYADAHKAARDREEKLRNQRPYLKSNVFGAGDDQINVNRTALTKYGKKVQQSTLKAEKAAKKSRP